MSVDESMAEYFKDTQAKFAAHLRSPEQNPAPADVEDRRMQIYRDLFYNNIQNFIRQGFPVLRKISDNYYWHTMVRDFFHRHPCSTPYFHQICAEFIDYLCYERKEAEGAQADPEFLVELAYYEYLELTLAIDSTEINFAQVDPRLAQPKHWGETRVQLSPLARLGCYRYPVHRISPDYLPTEALVQPLYLVVYRNRGDSVRFLKVNDFVAAFLQCLEAPDWSTTDAVLHALASQSHRDVESLQGSARELIVQLMGLDILI